MTPEKRPGGLRAVFVSALGMRPGWRFALFVLLYYLCGPILEYVLPKIHFPDWDMTWFGMSSNEWLNLVALKSAGHERSCSFFKGNADPTAGDLAVLCVGAANGRLLVSSGGTAHTLVWDGPGAPSNLYLPSSWLEDGP